MNKFIRRRYALLFFLAYAFAGNGISQTLQYLTPFEFSIGNTHAIQVAGKINDRYIVYYDRPFSSPEIIYFNQQGIQEGNLNLHFIKPGLATSVNMICLDDHMNLVVQEVRNNKHYTMVARINEKAELTDGPHYIDSARYDLYGNAAHYTILSSPDKKFTLLYRIISGFSSYQVLFNGILLNEDALMQSSTSFYIPINAELEQTGTVFLNNEGKLFLLAYDKATNYRVGTNLRVYESLCNNLAPRVTEIYLKENKPTDLMMDWYDAKKQLVLGGLYYNFYNKRIEGAMTIFLEPGYSRPDTVVYQPLEKEFRKKLKTKIYNASTTDIINSLQTRYFDVAENGSVTLLTDMFTNFAAFGRLLPGAQNPWASSASINRRNQIVNNPQSLQDLQRDLMSFRNPAGVNSGNGRINPDRSTTGTGRGRSLNSPASTATNTLQNQALLEAYQASTSIDAGDVLSRNKTLDYKSVFFCIDSLRHSTWKDWVRSLYIPDTEFSNVIIFPHENSLSLLNYEVNSRNYPYLISQHFQPFEKVSGKPIGKAGTPMLFHKKNAVLIDKNNLLTIYYDSEQNKTGLALVTWN
jgi:hypothetical protein